MAKSKQTKSRTVRGADEPIEGDLLVEQTHARTPRDLEAAETRDRHNQVYIERLNAMQEERMGKEPEAAKMTEGEGGSFVLLAGEFSDRNGQKYVYSPGSEVVVESDRPLDELFMNKFRRLDSETSIGRDYRQVWDRAGLEDGPMAERLPHGQHTPFSQHSDPNAVKALAERREGSAARAARGKAAATEEEGEEDDPGEDMTDDFEGAKDASLVVHKKGRLYQVSDADKPGKALHKDEFTRKEQVTEFIQKQSK